ncbi:Thiamin-phosphate pyrophosphorylase [Chitinispirillum alkaliphilum]|nr:Thiamin-phosphate pyrophosphorylase [Chitinispirillum alkaliphilum]
MDANLNRLREALRVIEEYFRFLQNSEKNSIEIKKMRHSLIDIETALGKEKLLKFRDTDSDCFAGECRPEELNRQSGEDILRANFIRAQEASRVIEEYVKICQTSSISESAKKLRFSLYSIEKKVFTGTENG